MDYYNVLRQGGNRDKKKKSVANTLILTGTIGSNVSNNGTTNNLNGIN